MVGCLCFMWTKVYRMIKQHATTVPYQGAMFTIVSFGVASALFFAINDLKVLPDVTRDSTVIAELKEEDQIAHVMEVLSVQTFFRESGMITAEYPLGQPCCSSKIKRKWQNELRKWSPMSKLSEDDLRQKRKEECSDKCSCKDKAECAVLCQMSCVSGQKVGKKGKLLNFRNCCAAFVAGSAGANGSAFSHVHVGRRRALHDRAAAAGARGDAAARGRPPHRAVREAEARPREQARQGGALAQAGRGRRRSS